MNRKDICQIIVIADRSGSMQTIRNDAIGGFNSMIEEQRKQSGEAEVTLVLFDDQYDVVYKDQDIKTVDDLNDKTFIPRGSTALYDAVGKTIAKLKEERAEGNENMMPQKVMFAIITDGEENSSEEYNKETVMDMVKECKDKGWEFIYLCADEKGMQDGQQIFGRGRTVAFSATSAGVGESYRCMSQCLSSYRNGDDVGDTVAQVGDITDGN